jgi:hypothetical protein
VEHARVPSTRSVPPGLPGATSPRPLAIGPSLWAITADVPLSRYASPALDESLRDINWVAGIALEHEAVTGYFASLRGATVVPMKLLTLYSSEERALADLTARRRDIARAMKRVRGCQEWGVRVVGGKTKPRISSAKSAASGTAFLAAKKRVRDEAQARASDALAAVEGAFTALSALSRAAVRREAPDGALLAPLLDAAFLVPATARSRFRASARRAAADCKRVDADLLLTGPWPPYNFVAAPAGDNA